MRILISLRPYITPRLVLALMMVSGLTAEKPQKLPNLGAVPKSVVVDIRTYNDVIYYQVDILEVTREKVVFEQDGFIREIRRSNVFRIVADGAVFTDGDLTEQENAALKSAVDYKAEYYDYVLLKDYTRYYGKITEIQDKQITIEQEKIKYPIPVERIISYRKDRIEKKLSDRTIPPHYLRRWGVIQEEQWHLTEGIAGISSPLNLFPQVTLGLQTNSSWPVYIGARAGASGNLVTAGWYFGQAQFYVGVNLFQIGYWQTGLVVGYIYRNHFMNTPISCGCAPDSAGYFNDFTTVYFNQKNYYVAASFKFRNIYFELGWEIRDYFSSSVTPPRIGKSPISSESQTKIDESVINATSFAEGISNYSRLYFSVGYQLFML